MAAGPLPPAFVVSMAGAGIDGFNLLVAQPEPIISTADTSKMGEASRKAGDKVLNEANRMRDHGAQSAQVDTYLSQQQLKVHKAEQQQQQGTADFRRRMLEVVRQTPNDDLATAIVRNMLRQRYPRLSREQVRQRAGQLTSPWTRNYLRFDPQADLPDVHCPVLLLQGTEDAQVSVRNLNALEKGLRVNKQVSVRRLAGLNHDFELPSRALLPGVEPVMAPALLDAVRDWVLLESAPQ